MNTSAFWIIALAMWIFVLQSKIKHLEKIVAGLLDKNRQPVPKPIVTEKKTTTIKTKPVEIEIEEEVACKYSLTTQNRTYII